MSEYKVGDIVSVMGLENVLFIVANIIHPDEDCLYRMIKVYPANDVIWEFLAYEEDIETVIREGDMDYSMIINGLDEEYRSIGYKDLLGFIKEVALTLAEEDRNDKKAKNSDISIMMEMEDAIYYNEIKSVNECIKAMNDLKDLHTAFEDEAYLQLHELVVKRFKQLVGRAKSTNEMLDVMNDLKRLHEVFGDKEYERLYRIVVKRIKKIAERG